MEQGILAELAEIGLAAARELGARLGEAETAAEAAQLAVALQRVSRSARQLLALKSKLARQQVADRSVEEADRRLAAERAGETPATPRTPVDRRRVRVADLVERCLWDEAESLGDDEEWVLRKRQRLTELLDDDVCDPRFLDLTVEAHVEGLCADLGVDPPRPRAPWPPRRAAELAELSYAPP